jgi:hypothetical protein
MEYHELSEFQISYLETLLWSSCDLEVDEFYFDTLDALVFTSEVDLKNEATVQHLESVEAFYDKYQGIWRGYWTDDYAAHDLALTRNSHGAGFWDRGYGEKGKRLSDAARVYGSAHVWHDSKRNVLMIEQG